MLAASRGAGDTGHVVSDGYMIVLNPQKGDSTPARPARSRNRNSALIEKLQVRPGAIQKHSKWLYDNIL